MKLIIKHYDSFTDTIRYEDLLGNLHREDGPAIIYNNGDVCYCIDGKNHREDGPAVIFADGREEWHYKGHYLPDVHSKEDLMIKLILE